MTPRSNFSALTKFAFYLLAILALSVSTSADLYAGPAGSAGRNTVIPPSAPATLTATATSATKVSLAWSAAGLGSLSIGNYRVFRGTLATNLVQLVVTTKTSYTDSTVSPGATYYYSVVAADTGGNLSPQSMIATITLPTMPSAPGNLVGTSLSCTKMSLTWSAPPSNGLTMANYRVYKGSSAINLTQLVITTKLTYTDTAVTAGNTYYYGIVAADSGGDLSPMSTVVMVTAVMPPSAPLSVTATATSTTKAKVSWAPAASGGLTVANYRVNRGNSSNTNAMTQLTVTPNTSYTDSALSPGNTYYYSIVAADTAGDLSPTSAVAPVTAFTPPSAPTGLVATPMGATKVKLTWNVAASGGLAVMYYQVYRGTSPVQASLVKVATVTSTAYTDPNVAAGVTYYYGVIAQDSAADLSPMSTIVAGAGLSGPSAPVVVTATATSATKVSVTWSAAAGNGQTVQYYQVFRGPTATSLTKIATVAQTSYMDTTVSAGNTYYYGIEAQSSTGDLSPMSTTAMVTVPYPPSAPTGLTPTPTSTTILNLTWSAAASGGLPVSYYQVFRGSSPTTLSQVATVSQPSYIDQTAHANTTYVYAVKAEDSGMDLSPMSATATVTMPTAPLAPTGLVLTPTSTTMVGLTWSAAASGGLPISYYQVYRGTSPGSLSLLGTVVQCSYTDMTVSAGVTYYYAVKAEDSGMDFSPLSVTATVTMFTAPAAPAGLAAVSSSATPAGAALTSYSAALTWSASTSGGLPILFYQVFRGTSPNNLSQLASASITSYTDSTLNPATTYYYAVQATDTGGDVSAMSAPVSTTTPGPLPTDTVFNLLPMTINSFSPSGTNFPGLPQTSLGGVIYDDVGYQDGVYINNQMVYFPYQVAPGGTTWMGSLSAGLAQPVIMAYNGTGLIDGFSNPSNWTWFDLSTLGWYSKGVAQPGNNGNLNAPGGYIGGTSAGNIVYPTPDYHNGYAVFVAYDSTRPINDPTAYQTFVPPGNNTTMGRAYGWCTSVFDGRFIYYAPLASPTYGNNGNIFRYDTTQPFSNQATGGLTPAWANFDMSVYNSYASGFQQVVYDGHRYVYYIPFHFQLIVRYDTWNGGTGPDPSGFNSWTNYTVLDPTLLNTTGYPQVAGQGNTANLAGFTGARIVWDADQQNQWLYLVPWATFPNNAQNPTLQSTALRVRVGTQTESVWTPIDFTSTATSGSGKPCWEMYDLTLLMQNPAWATTWPLFQTSPELSSETSLGGWQGSWTATSNSAGVTFPPRVGFVADAAQFLVEHDVGHHLYDVTGWYVSLIPSTYNMGTMGGGYDPVNAILYPGSPNVPLYAFQFQ